ncbi:unnamed protein product [Pocillopora meandrina]|uniref:Uncharacterized protein n=1 Tax=Pocillopora meandrina TaxID=46732 RepID=A0AAU9VS51_9CNID|nr:unnamed protein product [Pocillopora meandrina]
MEPNTITSEHFHGWRLKTNFSTASLEWAYYPNKTEEHRFLEDCRMIDVYLCTQEKFQFLRDKGYNVVEMWECQWCKMKE